MIEETPAVVAHNLSLSGDEGPVFGPLDCTIPAGGLTNLTGAGGSGRTALALVLAGRMKPTEGELSVLGQTRRSNIQKRVAVAGIDQIDFLERSVKVRDVLNENKSWARPWFRFFRPATEEDLRYYCEDLYGPRDLPPLDSYVSQLPSLDKLLLRVALALKPAHGHEIDMLIMDDLEQVHSFADREFLLHTLDHLSERMTVVVNSVNPIDDCVQPRAVIELNTNQGHFVPDNSGKSYDWDQYEATPADEHHSPQDDAMARKVASEGRE